MASTQLADLRPGLRFLQDADDLFFIEPRSFPACLPFRQTLTYRWDTWRGKGQTGSVSLAILRLNFYVDWAD
jgi:hypothetical protein